VNIRCHRYSHQPACDASTRKVPNAPQAARVARKPCHQLSRIRSRRTISLPSQKSLLVVGSMPRRPRPSCEIGRTPRGQLGGGSIVEYRIARISSQVFAMLLSPVLSTNPSIVQPVITAIACNTAAIAVAAAAELFQIACLLSPADICSTPTRAPYPLPMFVGTLMIAAYNQSAPDRNPAPIDNQMSAT
jgi:hypothetical protein